MDKVKINYSKMTLDDVLLQASHSETHNETQKWLAYQSSVSYEDFKTIWQSAVSPGYYDEVFTEPPLYLALDVMDKKIKELPNNQILFRMWTIDILTNDSFNDFLDKYVEKILVPNLTPIEQLPGMEYLRDVEKESLLLSISLDIGSGYVNDLLQTENYSDKHEAVGYILQILSCINKGNDREKLKCFESIDAIFSHTPKTKDKFTKLLGIDKASNFSDMASVAKNSIYTNEIITNYDLNRIFKVIESYELHESLSESLETTKPKVAKPKI